MLEQTKYKKGDRVKFFLYGKHYIGRIITILEGEVSYPIQVVLDGEADDDLPLVFTYDGRYYPYGETILKVIEDD